MTFRQFAFNNVFRNKRLYAAYYLSSLFTVMVFFTFAIFAFHPVFSAESINSKALFGMTVAGGIIYVFSFFFVLYSMSSFLQSRKKEFGLLMVHGASSKQIRLMVFLENMLIGLFATISGILLGLVFAKAILLLAENVLIIDESLYFYFPVLAIVVTFLSFIVLFLFISFFVSFILRTKKLMDLIKGDKQSKGEPKASVLLAILAALLLIVGYGTALYAKGIEVVFVMVPVIIVVMIGTYLLFTQLSVYIIRRLKNNPGIFWHKTNMLLFSDLSFRIKDNARTFFMVAMISTVAFSAIGTLFGIQSFLTGGLKEANPYTVTYAPAKDESEAAVQQTVEQIQSILEKNAVEAKMEHIDFSYFEHPSHERGVLVVRAEDYNRFADLIGEKELNTQQDEVIAVERSTRNILNNHDADKLLDIPITLENGQQIKPEKMVASEVLPELNEYYIVSDNVYNHLGDALRYETYFVWKTANGNKDTLIKAGQEMTEQIGFQVHAIDYTIYEVDKAFGPVFFIGLFIGIVFFVAAGSFLYFRLYTDLETDIRKFESIAKIGLSQDELHKVVNRQTALLFFAPILVALVHGAVALTALSHLYNFNMIREASLVLGSFALIQIIYFLVVRYFYIKQIKTAIY